MWTWIQYSGGLLLGWGLGANDSANVFGTAVSSRMVRYSLAVVLTALFVILGAVMQGQAGIETLSKDLTGNNVSSSVKIELSQNGSKNPIDKAAQTAMIASFSAALAIMVLTIMKLPVSTSQAVVGAIIGVGFMRHDVNFSGLGKVVACWIGTPVGAILFTVIFYWLFKKILEKWNPSVFVYDPLMSMLLIVCGCYGAYALGANNVANVSAVFVSGGMLSVKQAAVFGAFTIAAGVLTFSKPVMMTVGKGIIKLNSFTAFICVLSQAVTVHIYAMVGVPVSTSQAVVGAVLGIGLIKGVHTVNYKMLLGISAGWIATPVVAALFAAIGYFISNLRYTG